MIDTEKKRTESEAFYKEALQLLNQSGIDYLLGGGFAMSHYTGIFRDTKDLDIFCRPVDHTKILKFFSEHGYVIQLTDVRWLAKLFKGEYFIDIIFDTVNNICTVDDSWFEHAIEGTFVGEPVRFVSAEDLIWCKTYVQNRERYDGADINHVILKYGRQLDWKRLMNRTDRHWHLLFSHLVLFQFVYPSDYMDIIPQWLFNELLDRCKGQYELPSAVVKVCRGPIIDNTQYQVDIKEWDYKSCTIMTV